jgi:pyruvate kinase
VQYSITVMSQSHPSRNKKTSAASLLSQLSGIRDTITSEGENLFLRWKPCIKRACVFPSALNLAHFIVLRRMDLPQLMLLGLSSLGHCESRVLSNLNAIIDTLSQLVKDAASSNHPSKTKFLRGHHRLNGESQKLLGPSKPKRRVRIMATLPTEAAENPALLKDLLANGVDLVRINCAHGDREEWSAMIKNIKKAIRRTGIDCKIFMDLGGPKLRTDTVSSIAEKKSFVGDKILLAKKEADSLHFNGVRITCTFPDVFKVLKVGAEIWIDDGTLGCMVEKILPEGALLRVDHAPTEGKRIKPAKGMNFPELDLPTTALTEKDLEDLDYLVDNADVIGLSFVQTAEDIQELQREIALRHKPGRAFTSPRP